MTNDVQFGATSIADERIIRTARHVARAVNALPDGESREEIGKAHRFLGRAVIAYMMAASDGDFSTTDYGQEVTECLTRAQTWAQCALFRAPSYAGYAGRDPNFAGRIMADDPAVYDGPAAQAILTAAEAARLAGVAESTWRAYVARGQAPAPDSRDLRTGAPRWLEGTVTAWLAGRPGRGARTDLADGK